MVADRMTGRLGFVGSNDKTRPLIEASFNRVVGLLETHLATRPYLLGGRPALADFGLWGQLYEAASDPTPGGKMRSSAPQLMAWVERMQSPKVEGSFEAWAVLEPSLLPLLTEEVSALFLPWSAANEAALKAEAKSFEIKLGGATWSQEPQKYHARSLGELRRKYQAAKSAQGLDDKRAADAADQRRQGRPVGHAIDRRRAGNGSAFSAVGTRHGTNSSARAGERLRLAKDGPAGRASQAAQLPRSKVSRPAFQPDGIDSR